MKLEITLDKVNITMNFVWKSVEKNGAKTEQQTKHKCQVFKWNVVFFLVYGLAFEKPSLSGTSEKKAERKKDWELKMTFGIVSPN